MEAAAVMEVVLEQGRISVPVIRRRLGIHDVSRVLSYMSRKGWITMPDRRVLVTKDIWKQMQSHVLFDKNRICAA